MSSNLRQRYPVYVFLSFPTSYFKFPLDLSENEPIILRSTEKKLCKITYPPSPSLLALFLRFLLLLRAKFRLGRLK